jgi:general secretion pathway protein J
MMVGSSRTHRQKGFTLVELLLAITLMSILLGLAYGGLRAATHSAATGQALLEKSGNVRVTHQFIRRQLNQMQPLPFDLNQDDGETRVIFTGDSRRIQYVAPMPGYLGQGGPQVQVIELVNGSDGLELLFNHQLLQGYDPAIDFPREPIVLMEEIASAQFEFLAKDENGELLGWVSYWDTPGMLPVAVRLDIDLGEDSRSVWPLLTTGVKVDELAMNQTGAPQSYSDAIRNMSKRPAETVD